jgi:hypothetical protein
MSTVAPTGTWLQAIADGTFVTPKHSPASTGTVYPTYRSITVTDPSGLYQFFRDGKYTIEKFANQSFPNSPDYYVITPGDTTFVPGSGVMANSQNPSHPLDRFVVVSGVKQGWHVYAEA